MEVHNMPMPADDVQREMSEAWNSYIQALEKSLDIIEKDIDEAKELAGVCTDEWCNATEHVLDEIGNALFSISEPRWTSDDDSKRIKALKRRLYDLYVNYRGVYKKSS
jgi:hypothetical protein